MTTNATKHATMIRMAVDADLEINRLRAENAELREALADVLRDRLTQTNLHQMPPAMRARLEKARAALAKAKG